MWRKIKPHTDLHEVLDGWHEPFCASHRYVIDKYLYFGSQSHGNRNPAFYFIEMEQSVTKNLANADVYKVFLAPRVGLEPTTPRLTAVCSTIDTVTYRKISLIECYVQITIEAILFTLFGYHPTGDLTNNILTQLLSFGKREFYVFENFLLFYNAVHKYP